MVRYKQKREYAIGIVYVNGYVENGLKKDSAIHVLWINKNRAALELYRLPGFSETTLDKKLCSTYSDAPEYHQTFDFIKRVRRRRPVNGKSMQHNQILYGPPGTGKTWHTTNYALEIIDGGSVNDKERFNELKQDGQIDMVTFHQSFTYEDFVEGIRPIIDKGEDDNEKDDNLHYEIVPGVFKEISERAENDPNQRYVLIIDEINRGNIAKIFGELITLIEPTKRLGTPDQTSVTLPYSGKKFGIPNNLYLIGTMNTADRSIALLDTALRRRFDFIEMMPEPNHEGISTDVDGVNCQILLEVMNHRITALLDRDHQLGHSYFMPIIDMNTIASAFQNRIIPLLQEYFYDDWRKIHLVLNHNAFMTKRKPEVDMPRASDIIDSEREIYDLIDKQDNAWKDPANYIAIYKSSTDTD